MLFLVRRYNEYQLIGRVLLNKPAKDATIVGGDRHRFVASHEAQAWEHDGFQQVSLCAYRPYACQIRAHFAPEVSDRVACSTCSLGPVKDGLAATDDS